MNRRLRLRNPYHDATDGIVKFRRAIRAYDSFGLRVRCFPRPPVVSWDTRARVCACAQLPINYRPTGGLGKKSNTQSKGVVGSYDALSGSQKYESATHNNFQRKVTAQHLYSNKQTLLTEFSHCKHVPIARRPSSSKT